MNPCAWILAPHPDDECIVGLLALRLKEECGFRVEVVPASFGSRPERREARKRELRRACRALGFGLWIPPADSEGRARVEGLRRRLEGCRPAVVFLPHARDGHPAHRATHGLGLAAMDGIRGAEWNVVETEYWHPLEHPNLMVAADAGALERLAGALACHAGEMARNDYAARLPAWMIDNVRRGAERVGGPGAAAPAFTYATLYRARRRVGGKWRPAFRGGRFLESSAELGALVAPWR